MELNKIAAAILLAGLIGMITGKVSTILYYGGAHESAGHSEGHEEANRGYTIEGADDFTEGAASAPKEVEIPNIAALLQTADVAAGEAYFQKKCATCHNIDQGGPNQTGPNLWGIVMRERASHEGFKYSKAMSEKGGNWSYDDLNHFLFNPKKFVPGTIMAYAGNKKDEERANLIAFLRSHGSSNVALPEVQAETAPATDTPAEDAAPKTE